MLLLLLVAGALFVLIVVLGIAAGVAVATGKMDMSDFTAVAEQAWVEDLSSIILMAVPVYLFALMFYRHEMRDFFRLDFSRPKWILAAAAIAIYALLTPLVDWLTVLNGKMDFGNIFAGLTEKYYDVIYGMIQDATTKGFGGLVMLVVSMAVIPAICEELFFRVGVQQLLGKWFRNDHVAIVVTALVFSFIHLDMSGFIDRFVIGLMLGYVFCYSRSLVPNVMLHFANNAVYAVWFYVAFRNGTPLEQLEEPMAVHWSLTVLCTVASMGLFWLCFIRWRKRDFGKKSLPTACN